MAVPSPSLATIDPLSAETPFPEGTVSSREPRAGATLELVQIFRGFAASLVMLYHVTMTNKFLGGYAGNLFGWGHSGVDFFFVLSGFVMLYAHYDQAGCPRRAWRFLAMRAIRIYPIYWCVLAVTVFVFWAHPPRLQNVWAPLSTLQFSTLKSAVFLSDPDRAIVPVAWTLTYELLFYAFFSIYILFGARVFALASAIWCGMLAAQYSGLAHWPYPILLRPIIGEFFLGCLAAFLVKRLAWQRVSGWWVVAAILPYVAIGWAEVHALVDGYKWYALPCFLLIWMGAAYDQSTRHRYPPLFVLLGAASYAIYLIHYGSITIFAETIDYWRQSASFAPTTVLTLLAVAIVAFGIAVHKLIEAPMLKRARRWLG